MRDPIELEQAIDIMEEAIRHTRPLSSTGVVCLFVISALRWAMEQSSDFHDTILGLQAMNETASTTGRDKEALKRTAIENLVRAGMPREEAEALYASV